MSGSHGVKVVIINTEYVKTDPASFKSVVQKLTGKDSKAPDSLDNCSETRRGLRNLSMKELDRLMKEMPKMEELGDYLRTGQ